MSLTPWKRAETGTEHAEQSALFMWANMAALFGIVAASDQACYTEDGYARRMYGKTQIGGGPVPQLARLFAIKNVEKGGKVRGAMSKAEGVKAGVPDICLPLPRIVQPKRHPDSGWANAPNPINYAGLWIELKRTSKRGAAGRASDEQSDWNEYLRSVGYAAVVCYGWEEARNAILWYMGLDTP